MAEKKKYDRTYRPKSQGSEGPKKSVKRTGKGEPPNQRKTPKRAKAKAKVVRGGKAKKK